MRENPCKNCGVYIIRNTINERLYIGSTIDFNKRRYNHWRLLKADGHGNAFLQADWNKHRPQDFEFQILKKVSSNRILYEEQLLLDEFFDNQKQCYNICSVAGNTLGIKKGPMSPEQKKKISQALKGRPKSQQFKEKLSPSHGEDRGSIPLGATKIISL